MNAEASNVIPYERPQGEVVAQTPMAMLQIAVAKNMTPETIKGFMDLQERWEKAEAVRAYNVAFAAFKAEAVRIVRGKVYTDGPLKGRRYTDLFDVVDAATPALSMHGLSASWKVSKNDKDWIEVTCELRHVAGHFETNTFGGPPDVGGAKSPIQARASTKTYLERYTLLGILGLASTDDKDGAPPKGSAEPEPDPEGKKALEACASIDGLAAAWKKLTAKQRSTLGSVKDAMKEKIEAADREAAK
jgi:hypothetical protein